MNPKVQHDEEYHGSGRQLSKMGFRASCCGVCLCVCFFVCVAWEGCGLGMRNCRDGGDGCYPQSHSQTHDPFSGSLHRQSESITKARLETAGSGLFHGPRRCKMAKITLAEVFGDKPVKLGS